MNIKKYILYFLIIELCNSHTKHYINCISDTESIVLRFIKQKLYIFNILNSANNKADLYFQIKHRKKSLIITSNDSKQVEYTRYIGKNTDKHECFAFIIDELFHANKWLSEAVIVYTSSSANKIIEDLFEKNLKFLTDEFDNLPNLYTHNKRKLYINEIFLGTTDSDIINYVYSSDGLILYICCERHIYIMPIINNKLFLIAAGNFKGIKIMQASKI